MMSLVHILKRIELFHDLTDAQLERIAAISRRETYDEGALILNQNAPGDSMYVIAEGQVVVGRTYADGTFQPVIYLGEGQVFGEVALLDQGARSASVAADQENTVVHAVSRDAFLDLCRQDTALGFILMKNLATDLAFKLRHRNANDAAGGS
ncbi:MAG: cyclic nucleotide-binding domain-containing protein [Anaerolineae bacterium]